MSPSKLLKIVDIPHVHASTSYCWVCGMHFIICPSWSYYKYIMYIDKCILIYNMAVRIIPSRAYSIPPETKPWLGRFRPTLVSLQCVPKKLGNIFWKGCSQMGEWDSKSPWQGHLLSLQSGPRTGLSQHPLLIHGGRTIDVLGKSWWIWRRSATYGIGHVAMEQFIG